MSPLLHVATALALAWAVAPFMAGARPFLAVLALIVQVTVWPHGMFGRADHHMLILLVFARAERGVRLGQLLALLCRQRRRHG